MRKFTPKKPNLSKTSGQIIRNKKGNFHSFNDKPAEQAYNIRSKTWLLKWFNDGVQHRDNDKPAEVEIDEKGRLVHTSYYQNGITHRSNGKPALVTPYVSKFWVVAGLQHRIIGPSYLSYTGDQERFRFYGVPVKEENQHHVVEKAFLNNTPVWVTWLCELGIVNYSDLKDVDFFGYPPNWTLKLLNVTPKDLLDASIEMYKRNGGTSNFQFAGWQEDSWFKSFLKATQDETPEFFHKTKLEFLGNK